MNWTICAPQLSVSEETNLGGAVIDRNLLWGLAERGCRIELLLPEGERPLDHPNVRLTALRRNWFLHRSYLVNLFFARSLFKIVREKQIDVLRVFSPYSLGIVASFLNTLRKRPALWLSYHHLENRMDWAMLDRWIPRFVDGISAVSNDTLQELRSRCPEIQKKVTHVIRNGIDLEKFRRVTNPQIERIAPVDPERPFILFVGRLIHRKGISLLLKSWRKVLESCPEAQLLVIGSGPLKETVLAFAKTVPGIHHLDFVPQEKLIRVYSASQLLAFPTQKEGFGLVVAEAMSCGLPVVTTDALGVRELVQDGETGYRVSSATPETFARRIYELLRDSSKRNEMGIAAARRVRDHFSWSRTMEGAEAFLNDLVGRRD